MLTLSDIVLDGGDEPKAEAAAAPAANEDGDNDGEDGPPIKSRRLNPSKRKDSLTFVSQTPLLQWSSNEEE
jgi:hypothetical protein